MNRWIDRTNGWMDGWMNGWMDEWVDGWMTDEWMGREVGS
jgi:organic anion transporter 5A